jgi:hypothetical protein
MLRNKQKAVAIFEFHGLKTESSGKKIITLLDLLIDEVRVSNDTVADGNLKINQGEIKAYMQLKEYLERGLPAQP